MGTVHRHFSYYFTELCFNGDVLIIVRNKRQINESWWEHVIRKTLGPAGIWFYDRWELFCKWMYKKSNSLFKAILIEKEKPETATRDVTSHNRGYITADKQLIRLAAAMYANVRLPTNWLGLYCTVLYLWRTVVFFEIRPKINKPNR